MKRELLLCLVCYFSAAACVAQQPYAPPPQQAIVWQQPQPVVMQGYWQPVPRYTFVGNFLFGPRMYFYPVQQQPAPQQQPQYQGQQ